MIKSMTGFGKSSLNLNERNYQIEIKSVNHRYLDIQVKLPRQLSYLEEMLKLEISKKIKRGKIDVIITFENNSEKGKNIKINTEITKMYISELKNLAKEENLLSNIEVTDIAKFPDVLLIQNVEDDETIKEEIQTVLFEAITKLLEMRKAEGMKIYEDLQKRIDKVAEEIKKISSISTRLIEEYVVKLEARVKELTKMQEIDKYRIAQEIVIYADKSSIEEEITRLNSHIMQFKNLLNLQEPVGKKIDFIIQEMNRETNTIGSKSCNLQITNGVIEIKTELENIREQIQNIE